MTDYDINISGSNATITGSSLENALGKANFQVDITDAPNEVSKGDTATVTAITFNDGEAQDTQTIELVVDTVTEDSVSLTLDGGSGSSDEYLWDTTGYSSGDYNPSVESDDDTDSKTITILENIQWTDSDWPNNQSESGVGDDAPSATDYDGTIIQKQYDYNNFSEITPDPIAAYAMHESSGPINDLTGTQPDAAVNGLTLDETGLLGATAASGNEGAADDYLDTKSTMGSLGSSDASTFISWVKTTTTSRNEPFGWNVSGGDRIFVQFNGDSNNNNVDGSLRMFHKLNGNTGDFDAADTGFNDGSWHQLAFVVDKANDEAWIYVDAVEQSHTTGETFGQADWSRDLYIFAENNAGSDYENTTTDMTDFRLYDTALTATQIQTLYDVVDTDGTFTVAEKSFDDVRKPDLYQLDYSLNGVTDTQIDVVGSPNTVDEETVTQQLDGSSGYSLSWTDSHTDFEINGYCESENDPTRTSTYKKLLLA